MIEEFLRYWDKSKENLERYLIKTEQRNYVSCDSRVKLLFEIVINPNVEEKFDTRNIVVIDDGEYQGTQIFILHKETYQPDISDYVYTNTFYGSCAGCDTLLAIADYTDECPSDEQVKDYMTLCLHLLQKCRFMED